MDHNTTHNSIRERCVGTDISIQHTHWETSAQTKADYKVKAPPSTVRNKPNVNLIVAS